ncbi:hypothetical protein ACVALR_14120 [Stenotrophomonas maltophilia]
MTDTLTRSNDDDAAGDPWDVYPPGEVRNFLPIEYKGHCAMKVIGPEREDWHLNRYRREYWYLFPDAESAKQAAGSAVCYMLGGWDFAELYPGSCAPAGTRGYPSYRYWYNRET